MISSALTKGRSFQASQGYVDFISRLRRSVNCCSKMVLSSFALFLSTARYVPKVSPTMSASD